MKKLKGGILTKLAKIYDADPYAKYLEVELRLYEQYVETINWDLRFGIWFRGKQVVIKQS